MRMREQHLKRLLTLLDRSAAGTVPVPAVLAHLTLLIGLADLLNYDLLPAWIRLVKPWPAPR